MNILLQVLFILQVHSSFTHSQAAYKIVLKRLELVQMNEEHVHAEATMTRISRYTLAFNAYFDMKQDVPFDYYVNIRMYEFLNNEYRLFAVNIVRSFCDFMTKEYKAFIYPDLVRVGAHMFGPKCPVLKGNYSMENYTLSTEHYLATLPFRNALLEMKFMNGKTVELTLHAYVIVDRDIVIRERYS